MVRTPLGPLKTAQDPSLLQDHSEPLKTTQDRSGPLPTSQEHSGKLKTVQDNSVPLMKTEDGSGSLKTNQDCSEPLKEVRVHVPPGKKKNTTYKLKLS